MPVYEFPLKQNKTNKKNKCFFFVILIFVDLFRMILMILGRMNNLNRILPNIVLTQPFRIRTIKMINVFT